jgi:hypothetical protein
MILILISLSGTMARAENKISKYEKPPKEEKRVRQEKKIKVKIEAIPIYSKEAQATENVVFPKQDIIITDDVIRIEITSKNYEMIMENK